MADPSAQGDAVAVPARAMAQVPCSLTAYPCACRETGTPRMAASPPTANQTRYRRIEETPGGGSELRCCRDVLGEAKPSLRRAYNFVKALAECNENRLTRL